MKNYNLLVKKYLFLIIGCALSTSLPAQQVWAPVPSPNPSPIRNILRGVSGTASNDVWAVGYYQTSPLMSQYYGESLILHWDGSSWTQFTAPSLGVTLDDLFDVEMLSTTKGFAAGNHDAPGQGSMGHILEWDGSVWSTVSLPNPAAYILFNSLHAVSSTDVWAVGSRSGTTGSEALALNYNGTSWTEIPVPIVGTFRNYFNTVHGIASNDVWAGGYFSDNFGDFRFLMMHWDGSAWTNVILPTSIGNGPGEILDVRMVSANDVWAMGYYLTGGMFFIHYDGTTWTQVPTAGGGGGFAILSSNDIWAVGGQIAHWDGISWTMVDSLNNYAAPVLSNPLVLPNGEIWAVGRNVPATNIFETLVYRYAALTSVEDKSDENNFFVYPNPANAGAEKINVQGVFPSGTSFSILSSDGKKIYGSVLSNTVNGFSIPVNDISAGLYFISIQSDVSTITKKLMITR